MSNKLSDNFKNGNRSTIDAAARKKAAEAQAAKEREAQRKAQAQQQNPPKEGKLNNWKVVTGINLAIAVVFLCLAIVRYYAGADMVMVIVLAVLGLLNMLCALWNMKRFGGVE